MSKTAMRAVHPPPPPPPPSPLTLAGHHTHMPDEARMDPDRAWDHEDRLDMIAENAYYRAERRGFLPGHEMEDWLAAEREVDALLAAD